MYIRAKMDAFLDPTAGNLDTISAEPLRVWNVTGTDEAIEAFRIAVRGTVIPDEDIVAVQDAAVIAGKVALATKKVAALQESLDKATVELADIHKIPVTVKPVLGK